ncbi:MAG: aminotransferase class I/II-fold pyridoxal phosphate-dependent enzyme, partial [Candidatus Krumholzibacteriota bacterium]|nr:aminotransferase class I/II-fold pyridoxal phosphate-dependent enzyme [Candidatus Krumholzibacteriota bacterium]
GMRAAVDNDTRIVFICNPNNPTSTFVDARAVDQFLDGLPDHVLVVMDEAYIEYVDTPDYPDSIALRAARNTIVTLRTFSKFYSLAGVRVGYAIADPTVVDVLHRVRQPFNVNRLAQAAGVAAVKCEKDLAPGVADVISERSRVRSALLELGIGCPPSQTNFVFADLGQSKTDLYQELRRYAVIVRRMAQFGSSRNTYRISVGTHEENDQLLDALRKIYGKRAD